MVTSSRNIILLSQEVVVIEQDKEDMEAVPEGIDEEVTDFLRRTFLKNLIIYLKKQI